MKILSKLVNFFFPQNCFLCEKSLSAEEALFCSLCLEKLPFIKSYCRRCGTPFPTEPPEFLDEASLSYCFKCLKDPPPFERVFLAFHYIEPINLLLHKAKFEEGFELAYQLGRLLRRVITLSLDSYHLVLPVPLSKERQRARGYNQSLLMLWGFRGFYKPGNYLQRIRHTRPQSELSLKERLKNLKGAFQAQESLKGKRILLFDDVMTSGATLYECAKELKKAGAEEIHLLVFARA